ncbi:unnamed protein product, partial [Linum tenue]
YQLSTVFLLFFSSTGFAGGTLDWRRNFFTISTSPGSSSHTPPSPTNLSRWIVKLSQNLPPMESPSPPLEILGLHADHEVCISISFDLILLVLVLAALKRPFYLFLHQLKQKSSSQQLVP